MENRLQIQLRKDIAFTESIILASEDLGYFLKLGPIFYSDLKLTNSTLQELLRRITTEPKHLERFLLVTKQIKMMALDLMDICRRNMPST